MTRTVECSNCEEKFEIDDLLVEENQDSFCKTCDNCGCNIEIEIERDIDDSILDFHVY